MVKVMRDPVEPCETEEEVGLEGLSVENVTKYLQVVSYV